jgi:RNA polymerase sigma-70 factor (ECF subfamily)
MEDSESNWIEIARTGDPAASADAFSRLVEAYQTPVYNLAYRMLGSRAAAEDAAQETFIRAYTRLGTYDPKRKFSSWLLAVASHYCVDVLRKRRAYLVSLDDLPPMVDLATPSAAGPEQVVVRQQDASAVQALLNALSPTYRVPIILRYWYDMSYRESAEAMGVSEGTIKTRLHRARAKLAAEVSGTTVGTVPERALEQSENVVEKSANSLRKPVKGFHSAPAGSGA